MSQSESVKHDTKDKLSQFHNFGNVWDKIQEIQKKLSTVTANVILLFQSHHIINTSNHVIVSILRTTVDGINVIENLKTNICYRCIDVRVTRYIPNSSASFFKHCQYTNHINTQCTQLHTQFVFVQFKDSSGNYQAHLCGLMCKNKSQIIHFTLLSWEFIPQKVFEKQIFQLFYNYTVLSFY